MAKKAVIKKESAPAKVADAEAKAAKPASTKRKAITPKSVVATAYDGATITHNLARIKANDEVQEKLVAATAIMCIHQVMVHRNTDYITRLLNGLGKGWRTSSLAKWAVAFMPVTLVSKKDKESGATTRSFKVASEDDAKWLASKARYDADPVKYVDIPAFWDFDPENFDLKPVDFISLLEAAVKRADGAKVYPKGHPKEGQPLSTADAAKNNLQGLAQAKALIASLKANVHVAPASVN